VTVSKQESFTVVIPTMWKIKYLFAELLTRLCDHELVEEVIIINNAVCDTPAFDILNNDKINILNQGSNIYVNPSWNLGVLESKCDKICISNDDIIFDTTIFDILNPIINEDSPVYGLHTDHDNYFSDDKSSVYFSTWTGEFDPNGFGQLMFFHKDIWEPVPSGMKIWCGDYYIFNLGILKNKYPVLIRNLGWHTPKSVTSMTYTSEYWDNDHIAWKSWFVDKFNYWVDN